MNQLQPIVQKGQRVLTTSHLATAYGTDTDRIRVNFNRNKDRFIEGKHYFALTGEEKQQFIKSYQIDTSWLKAPVFYIWTEKGAWLHAKSLNTDEAWDAYEKLVDEYYRIKENVVPLSKDQALVTVLRTTADLVEQQDLIVKEQHEIRKLVSQIDNKIEEQITLDHGEQRRIQKCIATRVYELCDDPDHRPKLFRELYREIKDRFAVASYRDLKRRDMLQAINYIENWVPRKVS